MQELAANETVGYGAAYTAARAHRVGITGVPGVGKSTLAVAIGTSQATISEIESGELKGSKFVLAICRKLGIAPPMMFEDQLERRWVEGGRKLRARRSPLFLRMLEMVEEANSEHDTRTNPDPDRPH